MKPTRLEIKVDNIPDELKGKPNWILWRWEKRNGKFTKPPYQIDGTQAKSNDSSTWKSFDLIYKAMCNGGGWDGIGFVLNGEYTGIDWDDCIVGDGVGEVEKEILKQILMLDSYTEISPSRKGLKTLVKAKLPGNGHHGERVGVFDNNRYFCITGEILPDVSKKIESRQLQLNEIIKRYWPADLKPKRQILPTKKILSLSDSELIEKACNANDGGKFKRLWDGDWSGYTSHSEGDNALCIRLAFWTGKDYDRIDSLFRQSGLMREKWEREDYRNRTITNAMSVSQDSYSHNSLGSLIITSNSKNNAKHEKMATNGDNGDKWRQSGDMSYVANCLVKGKCDANTSRQVLEILYKNCYQEISEIELNQKIDEDFEKCSRREKNIASEVREWVMATNGVFSATNGDIERQMATKIDRKTLNKILERMSKENPPLIEKAGKRNGEWRLVDQDCSPMDWINASCEYKELWMPLGLGEICGVQPGNILVFAGAKDSGKTAFLMNIAKENRYKYKIHYFNSEMGAAEFKMRASLFGEPISTWKDISVYERSDNFADVIKPGEGNLNIIDFLEVVDEFWKVASTIQKIHKKLDGALCVIAIQKNPQADLGRGGAFSLEKARLYISLDYQLAKIISCKNFKENDIIRGNPRGYTTKYKLIQGCRITKEPPGWTSQIEKEKKT